jgi:hypothetical protein
MLEITALSSCLSQRRRRMFGAGAVVALLLAAGGASAWSRWLTAGPRPDGTGVTPNGWRITPAGKQTVVGPGPLAVATTPDGALVLVEDAGYADHALLVVDAKTGAVLQKFSDAETAIPLWPSSAKGSHRTTTSSRDSSSRSTISTASGCVNFVITRRQDSFR